MLMSYWETWALIFSNWIFYIWIRVSLSATARWSLDVKIVLRRQMAVSHVQSCPFFATQTPKLVMRPRIAAKRGAKPTIGYYFFAVYIVHEYPNGFKSFLEEQYGSFEFNSGGSSLLHYEYSLLKGTSINDLRCFLAIFYLPTNLVLLYLI